jgi:hypothetical protein
MRLSVVSCFKKQEITDWDKKHLKEKILFISYVYHALTVW